MIATVAAVILSAGMVARAADARLLSGSEAHVFTGVSTDTRAMAPGTLFVALKGERFDGHTFVAAALERGAAGVLISRPVDRPAAPTVVIEAEDTLVALQALARAVRRASAATVVAITGSTGKTTTKELLAELLSLRHARVFRNKGNLNNHIGLPLSLIELAAGYDVAVVELGMNHDGEIRTLVGIAEPDVRVWTNVGDAHIGHFGSRDAVARAKAEILEQAGASTLLVANADDPLVAAHAEAFRGRRVMFGESPRADVRATAIVDRGFDGTDAEVSAFGSLVSLHIPLPGRALVANVLAAVAVAVELDVAITAVASKVAAFPAMPRRGRVTLLASGARLVDDSYNASPAAVGAMLAALAATPTRGRRIAVLGEMLELGELSRALHDQCGRAAAAARVDELVVVGGSDADGLVVGARAGGIAPERIHRFATSAAAAGAVAGLVRPGDLVLVKGSRGTRTDLVADALMEAA